MDSTKAISVKQPWANMIAAGEKTIETRTWKTSYRGPLLIVSSRKPATPPPAGHIVAMVRMIDCRPMEPRDIEYACCPMYDGAYSWVFDTIRVVAPIPARGKLGLYELPYTHKELHLSFPPVVI